MWRRLNHATPSMNIRLPLASFPLSCFVGRFFTAPLWVALGASLLLSACASSGTPAGPTATNDPIHRHALVRPASPAPQWEGLRERMRTATAPLPGVQVGAADAQGVRIEIPVADGFTSGSTVIRSSLAHALEAIAPALADEASVAIKVIGHTDSQGGEMVNLRLSIERAEAVVSYLSERGIALERLSADGHGEADPLTSNATEEGRARNRRVELLLRAMP